MTTLMPADRHSRTASGTLGRSGSARPTRPRNSNAKSCWRVRPCLPGEGGAGDAQHAQALGGHRVDGLRQRGAIRGVEMAQVGDRFGRALGGDDELLPVVGRLPDLGHGEQIGAKPVGVHELPVRPCEMLGLGQLLAAEVVERLLHRVERVWRAGENAELDQVMETSPAFSRRRLAGPKNCRRP